MTLETNLSRKPYFDDFIETSDYYRVLFKPGAAVQTRELNQIQSILHDQINKFGRNVFKEGSVVEGCTFTFDNKRPYVKINDAFANSVAFTITDFIGQYVYNSNGLKALIVDTNQGYLSQAPNTNTLYVKYINAANFANGVQQTAFLPGETITIATSANLSIGNVVVCSNATNANIGNPTGFGYAMSTTSGIVFKKGTFLYVQPQTILVSPYDNMPDGVSVGFDAAESIETALANTDLYDNAAGSPNYSAPGADRLAIIPQLIVRNTADIANNTSFFSLADFKSGAAVTVKQTAQYSTIGTELARRTYETNGDFVVSPFVLNTKDLANTSDPNYASYVNLIASKGLGYVEGYRVEYLNNNIAQLRRGTDYALSNQQIVTANFGNYVYTQEFIGEFGDSTSVIEVELHNVAKTAITSGTLLSTSFSDTTKIGTAYIRGFSFDNGTIGTPSAQYRMYLFNIVMNAGQNFNNVRSIIYNNGGMAGCADVVLTYNATTSSYTAVLQQTYNNGMIFPFGQRAIKSNGFNNTEYVYRRKGSTQFLTTGNASVTIPAAVGTGNEAFPYLGTLSSAETQDFYIVPTATGNTANLTGLVGVSDSNVAVFGSSTSFLSDYNVGDYIGVDGQNRLITFIANNTYMNVESTFTTSKTANGHYKVFPAGSPINMSPANRTISVTSTSAQISIGDTPSAPFNVDVFYSVNRSQTVPIKKIINRNVFVKVDCSNNIAGHIGPWNLGLPDVYSIDGVWLGTAGNYSNSDVNYVNNFTFNTGQRDTHYDLATLNLTTNSPADHLNVNSTILVQLTTFTYDQSQGVGFFTANSYPIDDVNLANTNAITTAEIPTYTTSKGTVFDLRDSVDYRPFAVNTAVVSTSISGATINPSATLTLGVSPHLPAPDSNFQTDLQYYLQRIDRAALDIGGNLVITEGIPSATNPIAPLEQTGTMTLGLVNVPPYPSLATEDAKEQNRYDYAITTTLLQNKRYTMKDIGALDNRIKNLEYYTSLSLLEQSASNLLVRSGTTGQNRFQNGIFVDPFQGFDISNTKDPQYYISLDTHRAELRPAFVQMRSQFSFDPVRSAGVEKHGELIMLNHTSNNVYTAQNYASKYRNCVEGNVYDWVGTITLTPPGTIAPDITSGPTVTSNIDLASNWINLVNAWGTQWGNWFPVSQTTTPTLFNASSTSTVTNADGSQDITTTNQVINNVTTQLQQFGTQLAASIPSSTDQTLGNYVTNVSILPYLKATTIQFSASGMKPNTRLYAYFGNVPVSAYCAPTNSSYTADNSATLPAAYTNILGDPLYSDANGNVWGQFYLPANTFKSEDNDFVLNDISDLTQGADAIQTQASETFYGSTLSFATGSSILSTRNTVINSIPVSQNATIIGLQLGQTQTVQYIPPPPPYSGDGSGCGCHCFIGDAYVLLESGREVPISDVKVNDRVYNHDRTEINTVKYIETAEGSQFGNLYSPSPMFAPFATVNHPMYVNGQLFSVDPEQIGRLYPWLDKTNKIEKPEISACNENIVYNLWVDGDGTFIVNGFGTTSIVGDGGLMRLAVEQGLITNAEVNAFMSEYVNAGRSSVYGIYLMNKYLGKLNFKPLNKLLAKLFRKPADKRYFLNSMFKIVGGAACLVTK